MKTHEVYRTENKINGNFYYGVYQLDRNRPDYRGSGIRVKRAKKKYGLKNLIKRTIFTGTEEECYNFEKIIVDKDFVERDDCYNLSLGGSGGNRIVWSEERRARVSERMKGNKNPFFGKKHTDETRGKMRGKRS